MRSWGKSLCQLAQVLTSNTVNSLYTHSRLSTFTTTVDYLPLKQDVCWLPRRMEKSLLLADVRVAPYASRRPNTTPLPSDITLPGRREGGGGGGAVGKELNISIQCNVVLCMTVYLLWYLASFPVPPPH